MLRGRVPFVAHNPRQQVGGLRNWAAPCVVLDNHLTHSAQARYEARLTRDSARPETVSISAI